jgi:hypothetical protein
LVPAPAEQKHKVDRRVEPESCSEAKATGRGEEGKRSKHLQLNHNPLQESVDSLRLPMMQIRSAAMRNVGWPIAAAKTVQN